MQQPFEIDARCAQLQERSTVWLRSGQTGRAGYLLRILIPLLFGSAATAVADTAPVSVRSGSIAETAALADQITRECRTGSLIFSRGDCLAVRVYTQSPYTHVGLVVREEGETVVYDSMNGVGVRRLPIEEYLDSQSPDVLHLFHPREELTEEETEVLQQYLESQLGRPYSVRHHVTGKRNEGVHCSEYVTDALMSINRLRAENPSRVSPASLVDGITTHGVYVEGGTVPLSRIAASQEEPQSWCAALWLETKECTLRSCRKLSRWFLCR